MIACLDSPMLVACSKCATAYSVERSALGAGRPVRCARCGNVKFARDRAALSAIAQAYRDEVEAFLASASISFANSSHEVPETARAVPTTNEPPAEHSIEAERAPAKIVPETPLAQTPLAAAADPDEPPINASIARGGRKDATRADRPALMIEAAQVKPGDSVLDVGAGSGYAS
jgi:predicted Zn finger-like uncharacterized protein